MPDIQSLVEQMTLEEKAALCTGATAWTTTPVERLGVPELYVSDGPHGVRRVAEATSMAIEALAVHLFPDRLLPGRHLGPRPGPRDGARRWRRRPSPWTWTCCWGRAST